MGFWDFLQLPDGHWQWRHVCEGTGHCSYGGPFCSRNDCIVDAMCHGYLSDHDEFVAGATGGERVGARKNLQGDRAVAPFLQRLLS